MAGRVDERERAVRVAGGGAGATVVERGETIRIVDVEGRQISDYVCFNLHDPREKL